MSRTSRLSGMRGDVPGESWPPLASTRTAPLVAFLHQLELTQWLPTEEIAAGQYRQLVAVAGHCSRHSPRFRARLREAGLEPTDLASPQGLAALPPLTRQQAQAKDPPIFCSATPPVHGRTFTVGTSGSTGEPVFVKRTAVNSLHWLAMAMRHHFWAEPDFSGGICAIRANLKTLGRSGSWGPPLSQFFETGPGYGIDIQADIADQLAQLAHFAPTSLVAYPSNLVALLDEMDAQGIDLPSLRRVRTVGETLAGSVRQRVVERTGAAVFDCYSSEEFGYIALQCPDNGDLYHLMSETLIVEVVDEEGKPCGDGEAGRLLVTDIHNHATPMIRYAIGDYAEAGPPCPCGRGLPTLRRILGRERNMIVNPDGTRHWPLTGYARFRDIAPISQYQMRQHAPDRIEMRLVVERPLTGEEEKNLLAHVGKAMGHPFTIELAYFEGPLPKGANGKFEEFMRLF
ncbi:MAG: phenylacetate--CoA ligase family protein [Sphingomonadales bacterium]